MWTPTGKSPVTGAAVRNWVFVIGTERQGSEPNGFFEIHISALGRQTEVHTYYVPSDKTTPPDKTFAGLSAPAAKPHHPSPGGTTMPNQRPFSAFSRPPLAFLSPIQLPARQRFKAVPRESAASQPLMRRSAAAEMKCQDWDALSAAGIFRGGLWVLRECRWLVQQPAGAAGFVVSDPMVGYGFLWKMLQREL